MSNPAAKPSARPWPAALVCAAAGGAVFQLYGNASHGYVDTWSLPWWWISQWIDPHADTQHGWLILALAGWLAWRNLRQDGGSAAGPVDPQTTEEGSTAWPALAAMAGGLLLHAVGFAAQQARISIVALLLFAWGVLRLGGGRRWGAATAFPLAFLVFALPLNVLDSVGFWLRLGVIGASTRLAHAAHIAVIESGTQLMAPDGRYNYDVAAACSGVRSLMALAALSLLIGYLNFRSWWRRGLLLALCFPLVYIGNVARISAIVFAAQWGGAKWGDLAHAAMGWGVFVIVLGGVLAASAGLARWRPETPSARAEQARRPAYGSAVPRSGVMGALVAVVLLALGDLLFLHHLATMPPRGSAGIDLAAGGRDPVDLPAFVAGTWVGYPAPVTAIERDILPPDTGYSRMDYLASRGGHHVYLSIVLSGRDRTSIHRPELCLVGQGWTIAGRSEHRFEYPGRTDSSFVATVLPVRRQQPNGRGAAPAPQVVAYWFVNGDAVVATHWQRVALDVWNRLFHARADRWAYVLLQADAPDGLAPALARMQAVLDGTLPAFQPARLRPNG